MTNKSLVAVTFGDKLYLFHKGLDSHIYFNKLDASGTWGSWAEVPGEVPFQGTSRVESGVLAGAGVCDRDGLLYLMYKTCPGACADVINTLNVSGEWGIWRDYVFYGKLPTSDAKLRISYCGSKLFDTYATLNNKVYKFMVSENEGEPLRGLNKEEHRILYSDIASCNVAGCNLQEVPGNIRSDADGVAATTFLDRIFMFCKGMDNRIYLNSWDGGNVWRGWVEVPGDGRTDTSLAAATFNNTLYLFCKGTDNRIYYTRLWPGQNQPAAWIERGPGQGRIIISDEVPQKDVGIKKVEAILPTTGALSVTTSPTAYVSVDGVSKGKYDGHVPITVDNLAPGPHTVVISECGYLSYEATVTIEAGSTKEFHCNLKIDKAVSTCPPDTVPPSGSGTKKGEPIPVTATLWVKSNPSGAEVSVDGVSRGIFSGQFCCGEPLTVSNLSSGLHTVRCRLTGYQDYESKLILNAGDYQGVDCKLIPGTSTLPPAPGTLHIESTPGAEVSVDGVPRGTFIGPERVNVPDLTPGSHTVRCSLAGYQDYEATVTVKAGEDQIVTCNLLPATGMLHIFTARPGAEVSVDGVLRGTFSEIKTETVPDLSPGPHTVKCSLAGYQDYETTENVKAGENTFVTCDLLPIASSASVKPGSTRENPLPYNTPVDLGDGWQIQVIQFWAQQPPNCTTAMTGEDFSIFFATIEARYTGTGSAIFDASRLKAVGNSSVAYNQFDRSSINWDLTGPSLIPSTEVFKGGSIQGTVCWEIKLSETSLVMYDGNRPFNERVYISLF